MIDTDFRFVVRTSMMALFALAMVSCGNGYVPEHGAHDGPGLADGLVAEDDSDILVSEDAHDGQVEDGPLLSGADEATEVMAEEGSGQDFGAERDLVLVATDELVLISEPGAPDQQHYRAPRGPTTIFLNFNGATLSFGFPDDARTNTSTTLWRLVANDIQAAHAAYRDYGSTASVTIPPFDHGPFGSNRDEIIQRIVNEVRADFRDVDVTVTTRRPMNASYTMAVIGGDSSLIGGPSNWAGVASLNVGNTNENNIALIFPRAWDSTAPLSRVISHELGHTFGLYHLLVDDPAIMSPVLLPPYASQAFRSGPVEPLLGWDTPFWQSDKGVLLRAIGPADQCFTRFPDVPHGHLWNEEIGLLTCGGVLSGFPDGMFRPQQSATRAQLATIVARAMEWPLITPGRASFSDVPRSHWAFSSIETAVSRGIFSGFPDGTYRPEEPITRAQLATVASRMGSWSSTVGCSSLTTDVSADHWACSVIAAAIEWDGMDARTDGRFEPDLPATRAEVSRSFHRVMRDLDLMP